MLGAFASGRTNGAALKSRRAMMETLFQHLDMIRLSAGAFALLAVAGCSGLIDGDDSQNLTPEELAARRAYIEKAKPHLDAYCASCHSGSDPSVAFMPGADAQAQRSALLGFDPQVGLREGIARTLEWYREQGWI